MAEKVSLYHIELEDDGALLGIFAGKSHGRGGAYWAAVHGISRGTASDFTLGFFMYIGRRETTGLSIAHKRESKTKEPNGACVYGGGTGLDFDWSNLT